MLQRLCTLPVEAVDTLATLARDEGYRFVDRLRDEWQRGLARFDGPGECLFGVFEGNGLVAVGGLHADPYLDLPRVGRMRRVYIAPAWRNRGLGRRLVAALLEEGREAFDIVRLRAPDSRAAQFYEAIGFARSSEREATHIISLRPASCGR